MHGCPVHGGHADRVTGGLFLTIGLNLVFIPIYGYLAASTVTVITEAALCAFGWWFVQRHRPDLRLPVGSLTWRVLLAGAIMGIVLYPLARFPIYLTVPAGAIVYLVAVFLLRAVDPEEWQLARPGVMARLGTRRA